MIKVDLSAINNAEYRLRKLREMVQCVVYELRYARSALEASMQDGGAVTDAMLFSLKVQISSIENRVDTLQQMITVLENVSEMYEKCEAEAKGAAVYSIFKAISIADILPYIHCVVPPARPNYILRAVEFETIDKYITPLLTTGEDTV